MAYDRKKIKRELIANIEADEDITTFEDAAATIEPDVSTLYTWEFEKLEDIKRAIAGNKRKVKQNLRKQWKKETASPTLQVGLYKLLATPTELKALSMEHKEHSGKMNITGIEFVPVDESTD